MNPDGLSYLDLASGALMSGPAKLMNAYWSPGYPALIGVALFVFRPSPDQEFPVIHFVNFLVFILTLWAFSLFFRYWFAATHGNDVDEVYEDKKRYLTPFAFCTFLYFTLKFIGTETVTPDLGVAATVFLAAGITCRLSLSGASWKHYVALGFVLGVGYYLKAVMFPLGIVSLALLFVLPLSNNISRQRLMLSLSVFLFVAIPLVTALSVRANRLTFGETGRLNYAWYANGIHWTDAEDKPGPNTIHNHPAPKLVTMPLTLETLEFGSPIGGTYPLWYDPSYWYAGTKVRFDLRQQIAALRETMRAYKDIVYDTMAFISGAIVLCGLLIGTRLHPNVPRSSWWQLAWPLTACVMYALVHVESRFLGAFLVLLWLAIYGALMFRVNRRVTVAISATVLCTVMIPFTAHLAKEGARIARDLIYSRPPEYQIAALGLRDLGLQKGDRLAIVGYAYNCYYARYDGLRIVAQIPDENEFWNLSTPELKVVGERLASIGVRAVVASNRPDTTTLAGWKDVKISDSSRLSVLLLSPGVLGAAR